MRRCLRSGWQLIEARILPLVLRKIRPQREQPAEQAAAIRKLLRFEIAIEEAHQVAAIFREASVAAR